MDAVIILNWNKAELTRACLEAARRTRQATLQWIVVDNGSETRLEGLPQDVVLLRNARNLGFAGGVNTGLRHAFANGATCAIALNNDAEPLPGTIDRLLEECREHPDIGLASAVILNADRGDIVEWCGGMWTETGYLITADLSESAQWHEQHPDRIWLQGTALAISRSLVETIGYFDEKLFAYWEDNDISRRSSQAGFRNVVVADALVRHRGGSLDEGIRDRPAYYYYYMARNELLLMRKLGDWRNLRAIYWALHRSWRLHRRLVSQQARRQALRKGILHGLLGIGGPFRS